MRMCGICGARPAVGYPPGWCAECVWAVTQKKYRTRNLTNKALKEGKLKRGPCEVCGEQRVEAHHVDYDKPFEIRWLCRMHHTKLHAQMKRESGGQMVPSLP